MKIPSGVAFLLWGLYHLQVSRFVEFEILIKSKSNYTTELSCFEYEGNLWSTDNNVKSSRSHKTRRSGTDQTLSISNSKDPFGKH